MVPIDKFYYPVDFLLIDTQSRVDLDSKVPLILGRFFLATVNANINCKNGLMNLTFENMTLDVNIFHVGGKPQVEEVSNCDIPTFVDTLEKEKEFEPLVETLEKEEEFEPLIAQLLDFFSFENSYVDCLYHDAVNYFSGCDNVQLESGSSWLPHEEHCMSFWVDLKDNERLVLEPLMEKPPNPEKCSKKKKEQVFKIGEQFYLDYPLD